MWADSTSRHYFGAHVLGIIVNVLQPLCSDIVQSQKVVRNTGVSDSAGELNHALYSRLHN